MDIPNPSTCYWLSESQIVPDGAVVLRLSAKQLGQARWGGVRRYQPGFPDYEFWRWVLEHRDRWADTVSENEISKMRIEYDKTIG